MRPTGSIEEENMFKMKISFLFCTLWFGLAASVCVEQTALQPPKTDLIFILDSSGSVRQKNFQTMLTFCNNFLAKADIDSGNVRVGALTFSSRTVIQFHLNTYSSRANISQAISNIPYTSGLTNTYEAIRTMRSMFNEENGDRADASNACIILIDGASSSKSSQTIEEADLSRNAGIHIYAIGIDLSSAATVELHAIANEPASENSFSVDEFEELEGLRDTVFSTVFESAPCGNNSENTTSSNTTPSVISTSNNTTTPRVISTSNNITTPSVISASNNNTSSSVISTSNNTATSSVISASNNNTSSSVISTSNNTATSSVISASNNNTSSSVISTSNNNTASRVSSTSNNNTSPGVISTSNNTATSSVISTSNNNTSPRVISTSNDTTTSSVISTSNTTTQSVFSTSNNNTSPSVMPTSNNTTTPSVISTSSDPFTSRTVTTTPNSSSANMATQCPCHCKSLNRPQRVMNFTEEETLRIKEDLKKELSVNKTRLSSTRRRLTSASDERTLSAGLGYVAAIILSVMCLAIMMSDVNTIIGHLKSRKGPSEVNRSIR